MYKPAIKTFEAWFCVTFLLWAGFLLWKCGPQIAEAIKGTSYVASTLVVGRTFAKRKHPPKASPNHDLLAKAVTPLVVAELKAMQRKQK